MRLCLWILCLLASLVIRAQCSLSINSFPYQEDFEAGNGNWVPGGTASDWSWGTPIKPVISGAASGTKCWIAGTLTQSSYTNNQNSTLTSPCFNFTQLTQPILRFRVFWETENRYDGASLEFSTNDGVTWQLLGAAGLNATCPQYNWYNTNNVTALGTPGWSGNIQPTAACPGGAGAGSGAWRQAQFPIGNLAGLANVRFRFRFAAGNICNDYDGFAIDDIFIGEQAPLDGSITFTCGAGRQLAFGSNWTACGGTFSWNFGDPASGVANTSGSANPAHTFSAPGTYTITVTYSAPFTPFPPPATIQVRVIEVGAVESDPIACKGEASGSALAIVAPAGGTYQYQWNTQPAQHTPFATGLRAGNYTVRVTGSNTCPATGSITFSEPDSLKHSLSLTDPTCGQANGRASLALTGGTAPYQYNWLPAATTGPSSSTLPPGSYQVLIVDHNNCRDSVQFTLTDRNSLQVNLGRDTTVCLSAPLLLQAGAFATYRWQDNSTSPSFPVTRTGTYWVRVSDSTGCTAADSVTIQVDCSDIYFPSAFTPDGNGRNDQFGALGNLGLLRAYSLRVYDRWGRMVFETRDPQRHWNGLDRGEPGTTAVFVWIAEYELAGREGKRMQKGTITRIR